MSLSHVEGHFRGTLFLRDIVIGMSDGLTVPFALAAGLTSTVSSNNLILAAGTAEIVAGAISMGLGGYLAGKTEYEHYQGELKREYREIEEIPEEEKKEVRNALNEYGISSDVKDLLVRDLSKNKDHWANFMMRFELGLEKPDRSRASRSALTIGTAYIFGGMVPLLSYAFTSTPQMGLLYSCVLTLVALGVFGYGKSKLTGQPPLAGATRVVLTGALAAVVAFCVGRLIQFT